MTDPYYQQTRSAFMWSKVLKTPFWAIYTIFPFILFKDLHATPIQIGLMIALKPMVSIFSMYWSSAVSQRRDRLVSNIVWAGILGLLPFFFFPFVSNSWFFVFAFGLYMMMHRGVIPAWMEIMKLNLPGVSSKKIFAYGSAFAYLGDGILPFAFGWLLDGYFQAWRWIFPITACISLAAVYFQCKIPVKLDPQANEQLPARSTVLKSIAKPWKEAWKLIVARPDFRNFQIGFMFGGSGLMVMQAVLPAFFMGVLELSYTELAVALTLCKGIGFALTSQLWARWMHKTDLYRFSGTVTLLALIFPVALLAAQFNLVWLYLGYVSYGIMQAGSELSWNLSGPIFSRDEDSSVYSSVNVLTVGLRGCVAPSIGTMLLYWTSPSHVLLVGGALCLLATFSMAFFSRSRDVLEGRVASG